MCEHGDSTFPPVCRGQRFHAVAAAPSGICLHPRARGQRHARDEALGVPHTEVTTLLLNGESCRFDRLLCEGDRRAMQPALVASDADPLRCLPASARRAARVPGAGRRDADSG